MNDVPRIDYDEQMRDLALKYYVERLPPAVRRVWDDKELRHHVALYEITLIAWEVSIVAPSGDRASLKDLPEELKVQITPLIELRKAQDDHRDSLERKLKQVVAGCSTVNMLKRALPEFEKYLPSKDAASEHPLAVANVVSDFMQAGWPAGKAA